MTALTCIWFVWQLGVSNSRRSYCCWTLAYMLWSQFLQAYLLTVLNILCQSNPIYFSADHWTNCSAE